MSTIEDTKFTDADYIREIAKRYDYPQIADFRAHHARLLRIADRLSAGGGEAVAQAQHDNLHDNIGQAISDVLTGWYSTEDGNIGVDPFDSRNIDEITDAVIGVIGGAGGVPAECAANGSQGCVIGPHGPEGEMQCEFCGAAPPIPGVVAVGEPK